MSLQDLLVRTIASSRTVDPVQDILRRGADVNSPDSNGNFPLLVAVEERKPQIVQYLLSKGANAKIENSAALFDAIKIDHIDILKMLVEAGANINTIDEKGFPLAFYTDTPNKLKYLFERGADPNIKTADGFPLFIKIVASHNNPLIDLIMQKGVSVNITDANGKTALMEATRLGYHDVVKKLISARADVNKRRNEGETAIDIAAKRDSTSIVKELLDAGAKIDDRTLHEFLANGSNMKIYDMLMSKANKSMVNAKSAAGTPILFDAALAAARLNNPSILKKFLDAGADINAVEPKGRNVLFMKEVLKNPELVEVLLKAGVDFRKKDPEGKNVIMYTINTPEAKQTLVKLINAGIDVNDKDNYGTTLLHYAITAGSLDLVKTLLDFGADVNAVDVEGNNPLHYVIAASANMPSEYRRIDIANLLISKGVDYNRKNIENFTPFYFSLVVAKKDPLRKSELALGLLDLPDIDYKTVNTHFGIPPVAYAAQNRLFDILMKMIKKGDIDFDEKLSDGLSLLEKAEKGGEFPDQISEYIIFAADESRPNTSGLWRGYTQSDLVKLDTIFETEPNAEGRIPGANVSLCPVCHKFVFRGEACKYMFHNCSKVSDLYHKKLYNLFKTPEGIIWWCTVCGRICNGHTHYVTSPLRTDVRPQLVRPGPGADLFSDDCTGPEKGGGIVEKLARFRRLREVAKELNGKIGTITNKEALYKQIEETWNAPWQVYLNRKNLGPMLASKKYNITAENFPAAPAVFPGNVQPKPNWNKKNYADVAMSAVEAAGYEAPKLLKGKNHGGSGSEGVDVVQFHHVMADGLVNTHQDKYISPEYLDMWISMMNGAYNTPEFGYCWDYRGGVGCSARLFPEEIKPFVDEDTYNEYRRKFNWKFSAVAGGANGNTHNVFTEAEDAQCLLPSQVKKSVGGGGGRKKTRRLQSHKKRKVKRSTHRR